MKRVSIYCIETLSHIIIQKILPTIFVHIVGNINVNFFYAAGHANAGFNYTGILELGHYTAAWNVVQTGLVPSGSYQVATSLNTLANNIEAPLALANIGAILASANPVSVNYFNGIKQNEHHLLNWKLTCNSTPAVSMVLERSTDGRNYAAIFSEYGTALRCRQPFSFTDDQPAAGVNHYRIKMIDADGKLSYSTVVSLINANKGIDILNIAPNPVTGGSFNLKVSAAKNEQVLVSITDMQGKLMQKYNLKLTAGFNVMPFNISTLSKGNYQLHVQMEDGQSKVFWFVVQ